MSKYFYFLIIFLFTFLYTEKDNDILNIGIIDPIKVYSSLNQGEIQFNKIQNKLNQELSIIRNEQKFLVEKYNTITKNNIITSTAEMEISFVKKNINDEFIHLNIYLGNLRQFEMKKEEVFLKKFEFFFKKTLTTFSYENGYDLVLVSQNALYANSSLNLDITELFIRDVANGLY